MPQAAQSGLQRHGPELERGTRRYQHRRSRRAPGECSHHRDLCRGPVVSNAATTATVSVGLSGGSATQFSAAQDVKTAIGNFSQAATANWAPSASLARCPARTRKPAPPPRPAPRPSTSCTASCNARPFGAFSFPIVARRRRTHATAQDGPVQTRMHEEDGKTIFERVSRTARP
jgi:hypothetical protein